MRTLFGHMQENVSTNAKSDVKAKAAFCHWLLSQGYTDARVSFQADRHSCPQGERNVAI